MTALLLTQVVVVGLMLYSISLYLMYFAISV